MKQKFCFPSTWEKIVRSRYTQDVIAGVLLIAVGALILAGRTRSVEVLILIILIMINRSIGGLAHYADEAHDED